jgi:hypothetical protein
VGDGAVFFFSGLEFFSALEAPAPDSEPALAAGVVPDSSLAAGGRCFTGAAADGDLEAALPGAAGAPEGADWFERRCPGTKSSAGGTDAGEYRSG